MLIYYSIAIEEIIDEIAAGLLDKNPSFKA